MPSPKRTYTILSVLGRGGFGKVYRARQDDSLNFSSEVAIKLLHANLDSEDDLVKRFRDEARILGLLRDRATVAVQPPQQMFGRWAVVMEMVHGESLSQLLRRHGPLPPQVAFEIVGEIARVLHKAWELPVEGGTALRLVHRDIKPGNIQITSSGEVKLLDFGIARADFANREAHTTLMVPGTRGYVAPERFGGEDGPEGDIYSLGVVLHVLVTGSKPRFFAAPDLDDDADATVMVHDPKGQWLALNLAKDMMAPLPERRPTARNVERQCADLAQKCRAPSLRDWAERKVLEQHTTDVDEYVGRVWPEHKRIPALWATAAYVLVGFMLTFALGLAVWTATQQETGW